MISDKSVKYNKQELSYASISLSVSFRLSRQLLMFLSITGSDKENNFYRDVSYKRDMGELYDCQLLTDNITKNNVLGINTRFVYSFSIHHHIGIQTNFSYIEKDEEESIATYYNNYYYSLTTKEYTSTIPSFDIWIGYRYITKGLSVGISCSPFIFAFEKLNANNGYLNNLYPEYNFLVSSRQKTPCHLTRGFSIKFDNYVQIIPSLFTIIGVGYTSPHSYQKNSLIIGYSQQDIDINVKIHQDLAYYGIILLGTKPVDDLTVMLWCVVGMYSFNYHYNSLERSEKYNEGVQYVLFTPGFEYLVNKTIKLLFSVSLTLLNINTDEIIGIPYDSISREKRESMYYLITMNLGLKYFF